MTKSKYLAIIGVGAITVGALATSLLKPTLMQRIQNTSIELPDATEVENMNNYVIPKDSLYKQFGIDPTKYSQKELDSMLNEAIKTILW